MRWHLHLRTSLFRQIAQEFCSIISEKKRWQNAMCKECSVIVKCEGRSTSGLHTHQRTKHNNNMLKRPTPQDVTKTNEDEQKLIGGTTTTKRGAEGGAMTKHLLANAERSLGATIARMTACDGFPFQVFCTSPDLRKALTAMGFSKLPNSPTTFKQMAMEHGS